MPIINTAISKKKLKQLYFNFFLKQLYFTLILLQPLFRIKHHVYYCKSNLDYFSADIMQQKLQQLGRKDKQQQAQENRKPCRGFRKNKQKQQKTVQGAVSILLLTAECSQEGLENHEWNEKQNILNRNAPCCNGSHFLLPLNMDFEDITPHIGMLGGTPVFTEVYLLRDRWVKNDWNGMERLG